MSNQGTRDVPPSSHSQFAVASSPVAPSRTADVSKRTRRYVISMSIRMVCIALMLVVPGGWKLVMLALAVVLPLAAVLLANDQAVPQAAPWAQRAPAPGTDVVLVSDSPRQLAGPDLVMRADGSFEDEFPHSPSEPREGDE